jgi:hypothetical protein
MKRKQLKPHYLLSQWSELNHFFNSGVVILCLCRTNRKMKWKSYLTQMDSVKYTQAEVTKYKLEMYKKFIISCFYTSNYLQNELLHVYVEYVIVEMHRAELESFESYCCKVLFLSQHSLSPLPVIRIDPFLHLYTSIHLYLYIQSWNEVKVVFDLDGFWKEIL